MICIYAEKSDVGVKFAAALGGISYRGKTITSKDLAQNIIGIKKEIAAKSGYIKTTYNRQEYFVTWGAGHFGTLKQAKDYNPEYKSWNKLPLPFFPDAFEPKLAESHNARQFKIVKSIFNSPKCEYIINATDYGREGELIFDYTFALTDCKKPYKRARINKMTPEGIREGFDSLVSSDENLPKVVGAQTRAIADWIVGANMTVSATLNLSSDRSVLNVGRVITPTLALIVNRHNEIVNFKSKPFFNISGEFVTEDGEPYSGKLEGDAFETKDEAEKIASILGSDAYIENVTKKKGQKKPPLLYDTPSLQIAANAKYGFTLDKTAQVMQKLYENSFITYPRTDSRHFTEDMKAEAVELIETLKEKPEYEDFINGLGEIKVPDVNFNDEKVTDHTGITTTTIIPKGLNDDEKKIYDLVAKRTIALAAPPCLVEKTVIQTAVTGTDGENYIFKTNGTAILQKGWTEIEGVKPGENHVPSGLSDKDKVSCSTSIIEGKTSPPKYYTDGTLVSAMETCGQKEDDAEVKSLLKKTKGIGRPSTQASILERLVKINYVERKKGKIYPTEKGLFVIDVLNVPELKSPILTAEWEKEIDKIENLPPGDAGMITDCQSEFIGELEDKITSWCKVLHKDGESIEKTGSNTTDLICPVCGKHLNLGKYGWYCSDCKFSLPKKISGRTMKEAEVKVLIEKKRSPFLKGFKSKAKNKEFGSYLLLLDGYSCQSCHRSQLEDGTCENCGGDDLKPVHNVIRFTSDSMYKCPMCGKPLRPFISGKGYGCSGYKDGCEFGFPVKYLGVKLKNSDVKALLTKKETPVIKGFTSKNDNKKFDGVLFIDDGGKLRVRKAE